MVNIEFSMEEKEELRYWRFHHPHPHVQEKMEALYLKSQKLENETIMDLCQISKTTFYRYLHQYKQGGMEKLKEVNFGKRESQLNEHRSTIETYFRANPPATVAEASAKIEELTGIKRGPTQVRHFLRSLGMKPRKVGQIPAKADTDAQEKFKTELLEPKLAEAQAGNRVVFFMDAAHFVFAAFLGMVWSFQRLFVKSPAGRQRLNVLAAINATTKEIFTVKNLTYITAQTVCELLQILAGAYPGMPITVILDNARYQRCAMVQAMAQNLGIELLFLPAYSPNLNLIERFWKFVKKKCLYSKYYSDSGKFQQAILDCIGNSATKHKHELESLLSLKFQTFKDVPLIGQEPKLCLFPPAKQAHKKVSSKAA